MQRPHDKLGVRAFLAGARDLISAALGVGPREGATTTTGSAPGGKRRAGLTAAALLESNLVGLWKDRDDTGDGVDYARWLRKQAEQRHPG